MATGSPDEEDLVPLARDSGPEPAPPVALAADAVLRPAPRPPADGWRRAVWEISGRRLQLASTRDRRTGALLDLVRRPLLDPLTIAFVSLKGGVGKTTACAVAGSVLASERDDLVVAVDCNADGGALVQRVTGEESRFTISDLLERRRVFDCADVRRYTEQARSRLEVLAANRDLRAASALDATAYRYARALLQPHFGVMLLDCGSGLLSDASRAAVEMADQLVIVTSASLDAALAAYRTAEWLEQLGLGRKVRQAVAVINTLEADRRVRPDAIESAFQTGMRG